jgi:GNAT superfamily N-acetyltransferase
MTITVRPVETRGEQRAFLTFPWKLYRNDPLWVPPLLPQLAERLNPAKNPVLAGGQVRAWMAWKGSEPAGTIALGIDEQRNRTWGEDFAMFGFFECIEDEAVADALLGRAAQWAREQGKARLWGPWMMDYEDSHGILVKGWDRPPVIMCKHNPPYYQGFVERFGMVKARRDSLAFAYDVPDSSQPLPEKLVRVVNKLKERTGIVVRQADFSRWDAELATAVDVLNKGLAVLGETRGFWDVERMASHARALRPVLDPAFVLLAEVEDRAVGWVMGLPDLNDAIKAADGLRHPWNAPQLWLALRRRPRAISMKSIAVDPEYWNRGVDALLVHTFAENALARKYRWGDLSLTGEDNPMTPRLATRLGAVEYKRYRIYSIEV